MITKIFIKNAATYKDCTIENLNRINYFFGSNGTGKTTISRILDAKFIQKSINENRTTLDWSNQEQLQTVVYSTEFVKDNFGQYMKGVFTLGNESRDIKDKLSDLQEKRKEIDKQLDKLNNTLGIDSQSGKQKELQDLELKYKDIFWDFCKKLKKEKIEPLLSGLKGDSKKFKEKVLELYKKEYNDENNVFPSLDYLNKTAIVVLDNSKEELRIIDLPKIDSIKTFETHSILKEVIVGNENVSIAKLINTLDNRDWVRQGQLFLDKSSDVCPFCQQEILTDLKDQLINKTMNKSLAGTV